MYDVRIFLIVSLKKHNHVKIFQKITLQNIQNNQLFELLAI